MKVSPVESLGYGIYCIDARYISPGVACCYLMVEGDEVAIIETGTAYTAEAITEALADLNLSADAVRYIIPTHVHLDHAGGAGVLMQRYTGARLVVHPRGARHMIDPSQLIAGTKAVYGEKKFAELYGELLPVPEARVVVAEDEEVLDLGGRPLEIRHTPGHAEHHFCVWDRQSRGWFTGDTFGISYRELVLGDKRFIMPTTSPVQFDPDKLLGSIGLMMRSCPQRMYLTHYSVLEQPESVVTMLCQQIEDYRRIALSFKHEPDRQQLILREVEDMTLAKIKAMLPEADLQVLQKVLALDFKLNAQGLDVWLSRQSA
jgi:glyoxylase-like metal-dependent hydrolase (beta-lactamase superfamily II)